MNQGELEEAESLIRSALELSRLTARRSEEAAQLNNLGVVLQRGGQVQGAIEAFAKALAIDEDLGSREGRAFDLRNLGTAYGIQGDYDRALGALDEALAISRELGIKFNEVESLYRRGEVLEALEQDSEAGAMFDEAARLATQLSLPEVQWRSLYALGRLERKRGQSESARAYFARSLDVAERLGRSREGGTRGASRDDLYEDAITLAAQNEDTEAVVSLIERRRGRIRLDAFANRTVTLANPEAQRLLRQDFKARDRVVAALRDQARENPGASERVNEARQAQADARQELRARFPRIAQTFTLSSLDGEALGALRSSLPPNTTVLVFYVGETQSYATLLTNTELFLIPVAARRSELEPQIKELSTRMAAFAEVDALLNALGETLFAALADRIPASNQLVIVPDPILADVPWPALNLDGKALIDRWPVSELGQIGMLSELFEQEAESPRTVAAFAYGDDLPFAPLEARAISAAPVLGAQATLARLRETQSDAWALAVHGRLDPADPLGSALELAPDSENDGRLEAYEVFSFPNAPALLTLSGCSTAAGTFGGQARVSLADSFLTAGSQTVVATQSRVSDFA
ncbi:MAG: tetratricopeptide repeat protein, partial [Myxococcota bacterium]